MSYKNFTIGYFLLFAFCVVGIFIGLMLARLPDEALFYTHRTQIFLQLRDQDATWLAIVLAASLALFGACIWRAPTAGEKWLQRLMTAHRNRWGRLLVLTAVTITLVFGTIYAHHGVTFSMDEYLSDFQARIFLQGQLLAELPAVWRDKVTALQPYFVYRTSDGAFWASGYRPVFAALWALFSLLSIETFTNTAFSILCMPLLAALARRLWPEQPTAPMVAVILLVTSTQFLITGMSGFTWPAHLFFNLLWLNLFLRNTTVGHLLAGSAGFLAIGLHQLHPHALFVLPFLLGLVFSRRWGQALYYATIYLVAAMTWATWHRWALLAMGVDAIATPTAIQEVTGITYIDAYLGALADGRLTFDFEHRWSLMGLNLLRFIAWENPLLVPFSYVAIRALGRAPTVVGQLMFGIVFSLVLYLLLMPNAIHTWGYRYLHNLLGNFVLIATFGWLVLWNETKDIDKRNRLAVSLVFFTILSLLVALPLRALQTEATVGPIANARQFLSRLPVEVVILDHYPIWFGSYLYQNDPSLRRSPITVSLASLTPTQVQELCERYPSRYIGYAELARFGVKRLVREEGTIRPELPQLREIAKQSCG